jgi:2-polyprenyl-3-methyl-5-hydroxy-6-metoxy-1,4-benzoquinol methylase
MSGELRAVRCCLCGSDDSTPVFPLGRSAAVRCNRCGLSYVNPRPRTEALRERLEHWALQDIDDPERLRIAFDEGATALYHRHLAQIESLCRSSRRHLLDVGCSTGALLSVARQRGWVAHGLEIGRASAAYAREHLGLEVRTASLFDYEPAPQSYDAIVLLEVIEHLEEPVLALRRIASWLRPGGLLLLSTPNFDSLFRRLHGPRWWVVNCPDEHLVFFTAATLQAALRETGFEVRFSRSRGFDVIGMLRAFRAVGRNGVPESAPAADYYASRRVNEGVKTFARALRVARPARAAKRMVEAVCAGRWSPLRHLGEQLVFFCARSDRP